MPGAFQELERAKETGDVRALAEGLLAMYREMHSEFNKLDRKINDIDREVKSIHHKVRNL
jgi:hypothetical protein